MISLNKEERLKISNNFKKFLKKDHIELEDEVYKWSKDYIITNNYDNSFFKDVYNHKINEILYCLDPENTDLVLKIKEKEIDVRNVPYMKPYEYYRSNWETIIKKKENIEEKKNNLATSSAYKCRKCGERKCSVSVLQTRSSDEPETVFIVCTVCKHRTAIY